MSNAISNCEHLYIDFHYHFISATPISTSGPTISFEIIFIISAIIPYSVIFNGNFNLFSILLLLTCCHYAIFYTVCRQCCWLHNSNKIPHIHHYYRQHVCTCILSMIVIRSMVNLTSVDRSSICWSNVRSTSNFHRSQFYPIISLPWHDCSLL